MQAICNSEEDLRVLECDARCIKMKRDKEIEEAFKTPQSISQNIERITSEYYPQEQI